MSTPKKSHKTLLMKNLQRFLTILDWRNTYKIFMCRFDLQDFTSLTKYMQKHNLVIKKTPLKTKLLFRKLLKATRIRLLQCQEFNVLAVSIATKKGRFYF